MTQNLADLDEEQLKRDAQRLNQETLRLIQLLGATHRDWVVATRNSPTARISTFAAFRALLKAFHIDDASPELQEKVKRFADHIEIKIGSAEALKQTAILKA